MCSASGSTIAARKGWLWAWFRERIVSGGWWLVPLSYCIARASGNVALFVRTMVAMFALIALRLWDDVEDIAHDRIRHPARVLGRTSPSGANWVSTGGLAFASGFVLQIGPRGMVFVAVLPLLFLASRLRERLASETRIVWAHVILLKVPALAIALGRPDEDGDGLWSRALSLYGFVGGYEVIHDVDFRRSRWAPSFVGWNLSCIFMGLACGTTLPITW